MANKATTVTFKGSKNIGNAKFTPAKATSTKANSRKTVSNIQKITYPSGRVAYRVRVAGQSEFTTSLKKAREIKKEMFA
jgi:hypothetical protein